MYFKYRVFKIKISNFLFFYLFFSVGRRLKPPEVGLRKKYFSARSNADELHELIEPLNLMPTKIEEKREKLHRMYARKEKKRVGMSTRVLFSSAEKWVFVFSSLVLG